LNHIHANAINTELTIPRLPPNRTYRRYHGIDELDPERKSAVAPRETRD
jgi:hypothetical protein